MFRQKKAGIGNNCVYRWGMMGMCQITYEIPLCLRGLTFTCYLGLHWGTKSSFLGRLESDPFQIWSQGPRMKVSKVRWLRLVFLVGFTCCLAFVEGQQDLHSTPANRAAGRRLSCRSRSASAEILEWLIFLGRGGFNPSSCILW